MYTIKIVQSLSNESVCIREKVNFKNLPGAGILTQRAFVLEQ